MGAVNTAAYSLTIPKLLFHVKRGAAGGITMNVFHGYPYSGNYPNTTWPGYTTFGYSYTDMWNSIQPCWQHMKDMMDYVGRNQWTLQQGVPKVDLAFYLFANPYAVQQAYNSSNLQDRGYTYDYLGTANLLSSSAVVKDGVLVPSGPAYKALIFASDAFISQGQQEIITVKAVEAATSFAKAGLPIVIIGMPPNQTLPALEQPQVTLATNLQQLLAMESVRSLPSIEDLPSTLADLGLTPRTSMSCASGPVYNVWRSDIDAGTDYVFFYNDQNVTTTCQVNLTTVAGKTPYIYDAWTGTQVPLLEYTQSGSILSVPITLQGNQTMIISLQAKSPSAGPKCQIARTSTNVRSLKYENSKIKANVLGPATISSSSGKTWSFSTSPAPATRLSTFNITVEDWHAPGDRFMVKTAITQHNFSSHALVPWAELFPDSKTWAGVGRYNTSFTVPAASPNATGIGGILHLGPVVHTMRAYIDGQRLPPIDPAEPVVDISSYLKGGVTHELMIEVTTPLFNRIKATANQTQIWGTIAGEAQPLYATMPYQEYGLLGPVSVQWTDVHDLTDDEC